YNPAVVYGAWPYPAYPPAYYPPPPGSVFATSLVAGIGFGLGVAAVDSMWGGFNWGHNDVDINVNRYNNINVNQRINAANINGNHVAWQHNPANRGNAPYADAASRQKFDGQRQAGLQNRAQGRTPPAPGSRDAARERAAQSFQGRTGQSIEGHTGPRGGNLGQGGAGTRTQGPGHLSAQDRQAAAQRQRADAAAARDRARANNGGSALRDAGNGERMRQQVQRGGESRVAPRGGGGWHGGGGGHIGGGGGHFGGRR
ncbi:DUF3300 domain-containing protein, partial [Achromobacter xylosoxidans]